MQVINSAMEKYINDPKHRVSAGKRLDVYKTAENIVRDTWETLGCVIVDPEKKVTEDQVNVSFILKSCQDWTGFEASENEIDLDLDKNDAGDIQKLSTRLLAELEEKYPDRQFCVNMSIDDDIGHYLVLRFHTLRDSDGLWCDRNIENYQEPVLLELSD